MIQPYLQAVLAALGGALALFRQLALPLSLCIGFVAVAFAVARIGSAKTASFDVSRVAARASGFLIIALLTLCGWAMLSATLPVARRAQSWEASAEATTSTKADAPPVQQYGPAVAVLAEHTYTRTLTLPPDFLQRVGTEGIGVLSPYLSDPTAENVLQLRDTFRRSGQDVVFTRDLTRRDEEPLPFDSARIQVAFRRADTRGYDAAFEAHYFWSNAQAAPVSVRFLFTPPSAGAVRDLSIHIGTEAIGDTNQSGGYEWNGTLAPGEKREAIVRYHVSGTRTWRYDLGSQRRRVRQFFLEMKTDGPVRFLRGSLEPTEQNGSTVRWQLNDLITAQEVAVAFPPDTALQEGYLQALNALPAALLAFVLGTASLGLWRQQLEPSTLAVAIVIVLLGLGATSVLANYLGPIAATLIAPLCGGLLAVKILGRWSALVTLPALLLPAVFLSPRHSGLLLLALALVSLTGIWRERVPTTEASPSTL